MKFNVLFCTITFYGEKFTSFTYILSSAILFTTDLFEVYQQRLTKAELSILTVFCNNCTVFGCYLKATWRETKFNL